MSTLQEAAGSPASRSTLVHLAAALDIAPDEIEHMLAHGRPQGSGHACEALVENMWPRGARRCSRSGVESFGDMRLCASHLAAMQHNVLRWIRQDAHPLDLVMLVEELDAALSEKAAVTAVEGPSDHVALRAPAEAHEALRDALRRYIGTTREEEARDALAAVWGDS